MASQPLPETKAHLIRRNNLLALYRQFANDRIATSTDGASGPVGTDAAFAAQIQVSPSMLSQIKSYRPIGTRVARLIEQALKLEENWLDIERDTAPVVTAQQLKFEKLARKLWTEGSAKQKREAISSLLAILEKS
ncbi:MAG: hypothetical protein HC765_11800 [Brachymonas sp.]|nr:hypothetical protein [Brachymonas sp.]